MAEDAERDTILVRASVSIAGGIKPGDLVRVDPSSQFVQDCLSTKVLELVPEASA